MIREVHAHETASEIGHGPEHRVDALRLRDRFARVAADDDAAVLRRAAMKTDEMEAVMGQENALLGTCGREDGVVRKTLPREAQHGEREHIVTERPQPRRDPVVKVLVGQEAGRQAAAFSAMRRSISSR